MTKKVNDVKRREITPEKKKEYADNRRLANKNNPVYRQERREYQDRYRAIHKDRYAAKQKERHYQQRDTPSYRRANRLSGWKNSQGIVFLNKEEENFWLDLSFDPNTKCEITGMTNAEHKSKYGKLLSLDHNHETGRPRRLLSMNANTVLGYLDRFSGTEILTIVAMIERDRWPVPEGEAPPLPRLGKPCRRR